MSTITISEVKAFAQQRTGFYKKAYDLLLEDVQAQTAIDKTYDIFLSHASADAEIILGISKMLSEMGFSSYIDWIEDPELDRSNVTKETADLLRKRINTFTSLLFATTENSPKSKWMPWECGYFDALKNKTAILPVTVSQQSTYSGQEYLGLYPYITKEKSRDKEVLLWVNDSQFVYVEFSAWLKGEKPKKRI